MIMKLENGYKTFTTFWDDFSEADLFGPYAVESNFNRIFNERKHDYKYLTELTLILNLKMQKWYDEENEEMYDIYNICWSKCDKYCCDNLRGKELKYFLSVVD